MTAAITLSSIGILLILLVKKAFKKHISARWQHNLCLLFFVLLTIPFIPSSFFASLNMSRLHFERTVATNTLTAESTANAYAADWLQDFAVPVYVSASGYLPLVLVRVWIAGMVVFAAILLLNNRNLHLIKESMKPIDDEELLSLFSQCKAEIGIKGDIGLGSSILVKTPMATGFFIPVIILPAEKLSLEDARYAILHELAHCKNKDILINYIMCLFQIIYWFNPLVYIAFKKMRADRELACDASILEMLPKELHVDYGGALLNFASMFSRPSVLCLSTNMGNSKAQTVKRIKHIASYTAESTCLKVKSVCLFIFALFLVFCQMPLISTLASDNARFHFNANNVQYKDLGQFFGDFAGSFVLYDIESSIYTIHNRDMSVTRVSPNSTYKIFSALIALEAGFLDANNTVRKWDGTPQPFEAWNQDHNLATAMRSSANWYFQYFDAQLGIEGLRSYLTRLNYGNSNLSGGISSFWIESSLRISPIEQVMLLRNLYQNNTIFESRHVDTVKGAIRLSENLSGKTGSGIINGRFLNGWFVGYVENPSGTFIFATYIQGEDNAAGSAAAQITLSILEDKGIYNAN